MAKRPGGGGDAADAKLRETLARYLTGQPGFRCLKAYPNAETALGDLPQHPPDVLLMDINLPGMSGIECVSRLRQVAPALKIIMLTVFEESQQVFKALSAGAFGYLVKSNRPAKILEAIREVHGGGSPMSGHIARKVVQSFQARASAASETDSLTARELQVLQGCEIGRIGHRHHQRFALEHDRQAKVLARQFLGNPS